MNSAFSARGRAISESRHLCGQLSGVYQRARKTINIVPNIHHHLFEMMPCPPSPTLSLLSCRIPEQSLALHTYLEGGALTTKICLRSLKLKVRNPFPGMKCVAFRPAIHSYSFDARNTGSQVLFYLYQMLMSRELGRTVLSPTALPSSL